MSFRRFSVTAAVAILYLAPQVLYGTSLFPPPATLSSDRVGIEVSVEPQAGSPDVFLCTATFTDLSAGKPFSALHVLVHALTTDASRRSIQISSSPLSPIDVRFSVTVDDSGQSATYLARVTRGVTLLSSHKGSIRLQK